MVDADVLAIGKLEEERRDHDLGRRRRVVRSCDSPHCGKALVNIDGLKAADEIFKIEFVTVILVEGKAALEADARLRMLVRQALGALLALDFNHALEVLNYG